MNTAVKSALRTTDGPLGMWRAEVLAARGLVWLAMWSDGWSDGSRRLVPDTPCDAETGNQLRALADLVDAAFTQPKGI